jgi:hypothetical protein
MKNNISVESNDWNQNEQMSAFLKVGNAFEGAAKEAEFQNEDEMQEYMRKIRRELQDDGYAKEI